MALLARDELEQSQLSDLHAIASELGIEGYRRLRRADLIDAIVAGSDGEAGDDGEPDADAERAARPRRRGRRGRGQATAKEETAEAKDEAEPEPEPEPEPEEPEEVRTGVLDILPNGSGFVRAKPFTHSADDIYISPAQIRRCELRAGDI